VTDVVLATRRNPQISFPDFRGPFTATDAVQKNPRSMTMTRIRARCPECGDVEFGISDIAVIGECGIETGYRFSCPTCADSVERSAVPDVIALLLSAGANRAKPPAPAISEDDLTKFQELLDSPDWFNSLSASIDDER
jgi:hypothetical protein